MKKQVCYYRAIETKFLPCTNTKGSRIKAYSGKNSVTISYPHELNAPEAHRKAAELLMEKMNWPNTIFGGSLENGGYCFVMLPENGVLFEETPD